MIIIGYDWWDDWMDGISRCHEILSWWYDPPIVMFYPRGMAIYGCAHLIYDDDNIYYLPLRQRLDREVKTLVFTLTTESLS